MRHSLLLALFAAAMLLLVHTHLIAHSGAYASTFIYGLYLLLDILEDIYATISDSN